MKQSLQAVANYWLENLDVTKVSTSWYATNKEYIDYLKEVGFSFSKVTHEDGNPKQRMIFYYSLQDKERDRSLSPFSNNTLSTRVTSGVGTENFKFSVGSPSLSELKSSGKGIPSLKSFAPSRYNAMTSIRSPSPILPEIKEYSINEKYSVYNKKESNPMFPPINFPKLYYRSNRNKNSDIMDSIVALEKEILRESQSLENLESSLTSKNFQDALTKSIRKPANSSSQPILSSLPKYDPTAKVFVRKDILNKQKRKNQLTKLP